MSKRKYKPEECFNSGLQLARAITDAYYQKHGHIKIGELTLHHYLILLTIPLFEDECMKTHTSWGLEDCIKNSSSAGFKTVLSKTCDIKTSYGVLPKLFLYIGKKVN